MQLFSHQSPFLNPAPNHTETSAIIAGNEGLIGFGNRGRSPVLGWVREKIQHLRLPKPGQPASRMQIWADRVLQPRRSPIPGRGKFPTPAVAETSQAMCWNERNSECRSGPIGFCNQTRSNPCGCRTRSSSPSLPERATHNADRVLQPDTVQPMWLPNPIELPIIAGTSDSECRSGSIGFCNRARSNTCGCRTRSIRHKNDWGRCVCVCVCVCV